MMTATTKTPILGKTVGTAHTPDRRFRTVSHVRVAALDADIINPLDTEGQTSWQISHESVNLGGFSRISRLTASLADTSFKWRYNAAEPQRFWIIEGIGILETKDIRGAREQFGLSTVFANSNKKILAVTVPPLVLHRIIPKSAYLLIMSQQDQNSDPKRIRTEQEFETLAREVKTRRN